MEAGEFDKIINTLEFENQQYVKQIEKEKQEIQALEGQVHGYQTEIIQLQEATSKLDDDTKRYHLQFIQNRETIKSLKNTLSVLNEHEEALHGTLHVFLAKTQGEREEHSHVLEHYEKIWQDYKEKYESFPLAKVLNDKIRIRDQARARLEEISNKQKAIKEQMANLTNPEGTQKGDHFMPYQTMKALIIRLSEFKVQTLRAVSRMKAESAECAALEAEIHRREKEERERYHEEEMEETVGEGAGQGEAGDAQRDQYHELQDRPSAASMVGSVTATTRLAGSCTEDMSTSDAQSLEADMSGMSIQHHQESGPSGIMSLPSSDQPALSTVTDPEGNSSQPMMVDPPTALGGQPQTVDSPSSIYTRLTAPTSSLRMTPPMTSPTSILAPPTSSPRTIVAPPISTSPKVIVAPPTLSQKSNVALPASSHRMILAPATAVKVPSTPNVSGMISQSSPTCPVLMTPPSSSLSTLRPSSSSYPALRPPSSSYPTLKSPSSRQPMLVAPPRASQLKKKAPPASNQSQSVRPISNQSVAKSMPNMIMTPSPTLMQNSQVTNRPSIAPVVLRGPAQMTSPIPLLASPWTQSMRKTPTAPPQPNLTGPPSYRLGQPGRQQPAPQDQSSTLSDHSSVAASTSSNGSADIEMRPVGDEVTSNRSQAQLPKTPERREDSTGQKPKTPTNKGYKNIVMGSSPFDLEKHLDKLKLLKKSPGHGFSYSSRPMFNLSLLQDTDDQTEGEQDPGFHSVTPSQPTAAGEPGTTKRMNTPEEQAEKKMTSPTPAVFGGGDAASFSFGPAKDASPNVNVQTIFGDPPTKGADSTAAMAAFDFNTSDLFRGSPATTTSSTFSFGGETGTLSEGGGGGDVFSMFGAGDANDDDSNGGGVGSSGGFAFSFDGEPQSPPDNSAAFRLF